jgi:RimJ/RimL family protein N-acetyltransferase
MIHGTRVRLRPIHEEDWTVLEAWGRGREALWGPFQRFQLDHLPTLRKAFQQTGLLRRESGLLLIETAADSRVIGYVRYTLIAYPDADQPHPEIGFGLPEASARGQGFAQEAVRLLVDYLFAGYPIERISAFTDTENGPARRLMEALGFQCEGHLRQAMFRDGAWRDVAVYGVVRSQWRPEQANDPRPGA